MSCVGLVFPHQLFKKNLLLSHCKKVYLVEAFLFFNQYKFHKQKLAFHRVTMKVYETYLTKQGVEVVYIEAINKLSDIRKLIPKLKTKGVNKIVCIDPSDFWLEQRIKKSSNKADIEVEVLKSKLFINDRKDNASFFKDSKKKFYQTQFYKQQRKQYKILVDQEQQPVGGKWSFDHENRKKFPAKKEAPKVSILKESDEYNAAVTYVKKHYGDNPGSISNQPIYPYTFKMSKDWFKEFLSIRFNEFGIYEDAIVKEEHLLNHSLLSPLINAGLIEPMYVIKQALKYADKNAIPINSVEGFVRQILGWREFIRGVYECKGSIERTKNFWGFNRKIPASFYDGTTGIEPIDHTIKKVLKTGYCHHIERLMILGNFMVLCEFHPDEVYQWFMELFIDAYDWVMVPNVYGMSQFADGGLMSTKPYISGSNYIMKMSNYKKGDWQNTWDALFWRFMHVNSSFFIKNPRLAMLVRTFEKWPESKKEAYLSTASDFLKTLD